MKQSKYAHENTQTTPSGIRSLEHKRAISTCSTTCHHAQVSSGLAGGASTHSSRVIQHGPSGFKFTHDALDARNVCANTHIASLRRRFPNNAPYQSSKRPTQSTRQNKHPSECTPSLSDRGASHHEINTLPYPQRANKRWREEIMITHNHAAEAPRRTDIAAERLRIDLNPRVRRKHNEEDQTHSRAATKSANRKLPKG